MHQRCRPARYFARARCQADYDTGQRSAAEPRGFHGFGCIYAIISPLVRYADLMLPDTALYCTALLLRWLICPTVFYTIPLRIANTDFACVSDGLILYPADNVRKYFRSGQYLDN